MEGGRRRLTLSDQMSVLNSSNLRDLLRVRDDDNGRDSLSGLTLGAVLSCPKRSTPVQVSRTLMDIIRDEETGASYRGLVDHNNKKSWKSFKDRLRLRRAGVAWSSSSTTHPDSDLSLAECRIQIAPPFPNGPPTGNSNPIPIIAGDSTPGVIQPASSSDTRSNIVAEYNTGSAVTGVNEPVITRLSEALEAEREQRRPAPENEEDGLNSNVVAEAAPVRMSLMALLEETDRQAGVVGSPLMGTVDEEEEEEGEVGEDGGQYTCCVCMVRHKGSAFIPCGHTFCRLCSRELWVSRGNCPLCNGFILEILDIF